MFIWCLVLFAYFLVSCLCFESPYSPSFIHSHSYLLPGILSCWMVEWFQSSFSKLPPGKGRCLCFCWPVQVISIVVCIKSQTASSKTHQPNQNQFGRIILMNFNFFHSFVRSVKLILFVWVKKDGRSWIEWTLKRFQINN